MRKKSLISSSYCSCKIAKEVYIKNINSFLYSNSYLSNKLIHETFCKISSKVQESLISTLQIFDLDFLFLELIRTQNNYIIKIFLKKLLEYHAQKLSLYFIKILHLFINFIYMIGGFKTNFFCFTKHSWDFYCLQFQSRVNLISSLLIPNKRNANLLILFFRFSPIIILIQQ